MRGKTAIWLVGAAAIMLLLYWCNSSMRSTTSPVQANAPSPAASHAASVQAHGVVQPGTMPLELGTPSPLASSMPPSGGAMDKDASAKARAEEQRRTQAIQSAMQKMQMLLRSGEQDPEAFSQAIASVEKENGSPILGGVNLDVLRHNLDVASQMSQLTQKMQSLQAASGVASEPDGNTQATLKQMGEQLQALGRQLNLDVMRAPQAPPLQTQPSAQGQ